ncbi:diacylglycerol kinase family lipid kinase [Bacillaceae bacterium S4-13-58]
MNVIITNPVAGNGRGLKVYSKFKELNKENLVNFRSFSTKYPGHAEEIARQISQMHHERIQMLYVIGGDGTFHEVLNGLQAHNKIPVSFIPAGSGNDFVRGGTLSSRPSKLIQQLKHHPRLSSFRPGVYVINRNNRIFLNSLGIGIDAEVVTRANQSHYKKILNQLRLGFLTYAVALIQVLFNFSPKTITLTIDGKKSVHHQVWMVTVGNHAYMGGGMKLLPNSSHKDPYFTILIVENISKWKILGLFLTVFWGGHTRIKGVSLQKGQRITIKVPELVRFHADGQEGTCSEVSIKKSTKTHMIPGK